PHYLSPTPSMAVVQFEIDEKDPPPPAGSPILKEALLYGETIKGGGTPCTFRTAHEVRLLPIRLTEARYLARDVGTLELRAKAAAAIRLRLQAIAGLTFQNLDCDRLTFYLRGAQDPRTALIYEQLIAHKAGLVLQWGSGTN